MSSRANSNATSVKKVSDDQQQISDNVVVVVSNSADQGAGGHMSVDAICDEEIAIISSSVSDDDYLSSSSEEEEEEEDGEEDYDEIAEREQILMDMAALKENAIAWRHPEIGVTTSIAVTHNYFSPVDCEEQVDNQLLTDLVNLKRSALEWRGEAVPVKVDPCVAARCFFDRASAMSGKEAEERVQILADARALREAVMAYRHPEVGVTSNGVQARCYFDRASADTSETSEEMEYRAQVLADDAKLKSQAMAYRHPEVGITSNGVQARCYFDRASADTSETSEEMEYRAQVLADAAKLKSQAMAYRHPEVGVTSNGVQARCYFDRASADTSETSEEMEYRAQVLADAAKLKSQAMAYRHPEVGVTSNGVQARCYFDRASADMSETSEEMEYRVQVLADAAKLKSQAMAYRHPEVGVTSNGLSSRNYFTRNVYDDKIHSEPALLESEDDYAHFDLDEDSQHEEHHDDFEEFKASIRINLPDAPFKKTNLATDEEEGSLSRSPSSVMLFGLESGA